MENKINKKLLIGKSPNSKVFKEYKDSLTSLTALQWETSIGLILGDASLQTQNGGKTYRLKFEWGNKQKLYVDYIFELFNEWVISPPHKKTRMSPNGNEVISWGFQTISHKAFNPLAELFITNNKKTVPDLLIKNHLTPRGLAIWFNDDGGKLDYNKNSKNQSIVLNTQSFTDLEVLNMSQELSEKFSLNCEVRANKGKKVIVIKSDCYPTFFKLVDPYIISEMRYKLPKNN
jgi:hypothetical protein